MKTVQPFDQITPEVEKSDVNSIEGLQHTISSSYNNENTSITERYQLCKDQLEGAGEFLHTVNTRERSGAFVPTDVVVRAETRTLIGGGCIFIYSCSARRISFQID